jgi:hypothetical protein
VELVKPASGLVPMGERGREKLVLVNLNVKGLNGASISHPMLQSCTALGARLSCLYQKESK